MACAEVATAKANATAINLIIVFSVFVPSWREDAQPLRAAGRLSAFGARAGREKTGANRPHRRLDGGVADCYVLNGNRYKELVKIAHPARSTAVGTLCDAGSLVQNHVQ